MSDQHHHQNNFNKYSNQRRQRSRSLSREKNVKSKLHIGNLPLDITEGRLKHDFQQYGEVKEIKIIKFNSKGEQLEKNCYAFITFGSSHQADRAVQQYKGSWTVAHRKSEHERERDKEFKNGQSNNNNHGNTNNSYYQHSRSNRHSKWSNEGDFNNKEGGKSRNNNNSSSDSSSQSSRSSKSSYNNNNKYKHNNHGSIFSQHSGGGPQPNYQQYSQQNQRVQQQDQIDPQINRNQQFHPLQQNLLVNLTNLGQDRQDINALASLLSLPSDQLKNLILNQKTTTVSSIIQEQILVRELWVGGLPNTCTEKILEKNMEVYGKIENLEMFNKGFAFVKYFKVNEATKACQNQKNISLLLGAPSLKIQFSDHLRRFNIVGDSLGYEYKEDLTSIIYIGYYHNSEFAKEEIIRKAVRKYGTIKNINLRSMENTTFKIYALVEFETVEQAQRVNQKLNSKKYKLQDKKCEVAILLKCSKFMPNKDLMDQQSFQPLRPQPQSNHQSILQQQQQQQLGIDLAKNANLPLNTILNAQTGISSYPIQQIQPQQQQIVQQSVIQPQNQQTIQLTRSMNQPGQLANQLNNYPIQVKQILNNPAFLQQQQQQQSAQLQQPPGPQGLINQSSIPQQLFQPVQPSQKQQQQQIQPQPNQFSLFPNQQMSQQQQSVFQQPQQGQQISTQLIPQQQQPQQNLLQQQLQQQNIQILQNQQQLQQQQQQFFPNFGGGSKNRNENVVVNPDQSMASLQIKQNLNVSHSAVHQSNSIATALAQNIQGNNNNRFKFDQLLPQQQKAAALMNLNNQQINNNNQAADLSQKTMFLDFLSEILQKSNAEHKPQKIQSSNDLEKMESGIIEDNTFWSGFITRQKQHRVGIDARIVKQIKEINLNNEYHLNVTHRTSFEEALKKDYSAFAVFTPSNQIDNSQFDDYINYFRDKQRAGVVQTQNYHIYLLPPCPDVNKLYPLKPREILGIFSDNTMDKEYDLNDPQRVGSLMMIDQIEMPTGQFAPNSKQSTQNQVTSNDEIAKLLSNPQLIDSLLQTIQNAK